MPNHMLHPQGQKSHFDLSRGIAALGRGPDSQLVHMSNKEVDGLQKLAMAAGGSLTRNPHTGLLEAGWLDSILPTIAGGVLAATGVGAPVAGLVVGAADAAINHKTAFMSGLTAGLGAYGGATIASGIAGVGAQSAADQAASDATNTSIAQPDAVSTSTDNSLQQMEGPSGIAQPATATPATDNSPVQTGIDPKTGKYTYQTPQQLQTLKNNAAIRGSEQSAVSNGFTAGQFGQGLQALAGNSPSMSSSQAAGDVFANTGKLGLFGAAAPAMYQSYQNQNQIPAAPTYPLYQYQYNPGRQNTRQGPGQIPLLGQGYSTPTYLGTYKHGGTIKHYDTGGISTTVPAGTLAAAQTPVGAPQPNQGAPQATPLTPTSPQQAAMIQQYQNQIAQGQQQQAQQFPTATPSGAWTSYLQNLNNSLQAPPSGGISNGTTNSTGATSTTQTPVGTDTSSGGINSLDTGVVGGELAGIPSGITGTTGQDPNTSTPATQAPNLNIDNTGNNIYSNDIFPSPDTTGPNGVANNVIPSNAGTYNPASLVGAGLTGLGLNTMGGIMSGIGTASNYVAGLTPDQQAQSTYNTAQSNATNAGDYVLGQINQANGNIVGDNTGMPSASDIYDSLTPGAGDGSQSGVDTSNGYMFGDGSTDPDGTYGGGHYASGGIAALNQGRLLKGPGDGMSDSIPAQITGGGQAPQPAALGDGEFVIPADVVSHIGNGSTDAGAKKLYGMMDRIRQSRTGKKSQAPQVNAERFMPA